MKVLTSICNLISSNLLTFVFPFITSSNLLTFIEPAHQAGFVTTGCNRAR
eukprot:gene27023-35469_t